MSCTSMQTFDLKVVCYSKTSKEPHISDLANICGAHIPLIISLRGLDVKHTSRSSAGILLICIGLGLLPQGQTGVSKLKNPYN